MQPEIKQLIITAESLAEKSRVLYGNLYLHDPRQEAKKPPSLATLAADAGQIAYRMNSLRVDIIRVHERKRLIEGKN